MMDFGKFDLAAQSAAGYVYHVADPLGVPLMNDGAPVTITVAGSDSPAYKNRQRELARTAAIDATGKSIAQAAADKIVPPDSSHGFAMEMLVACTLGWQGITWNGKALAFTPENARMLYNRHEWLRENVASVVLDRAHFLDYAPAG